MTNFNTKAEMPNESFEPFINPVGLTIIGLAILAVVLGAIDFVSPE